jgi:hypothetical protein
MLGLFNKAFIKTQRLSVKKARVAILEIETVTKKHSAGLASFLPLASEPRWQRFGAVS